MNTRGDRRRVSLTASLLFVLITPTAPAAQTRPATAAADVAWKTIEPGLELRMMDGGAACRRGSPLIAVVRFQPERWRLDLFHESEGGAAGRRGLDVEEWRDRTGAAVMINAGQYYPDHVPMGLFMKEGRNLGTRQIKSWKGLLVAEPARAGVPAAAILDLEHDAFDVATTPYRLALQSFMILDRDGKKRVRRSEWHANRTALATDRSGRLLALHTEGAYTLWELADWIARSDLGVMQALSLDGGFESQLAINAGSTRYLSFGRWHVDDKGDHSIEGLRVPLPAVLGVFARPAATSSR